MGNPFCIAGRDLNDRRALSPLEFPEHEHLYVPVDNTQGAFDNLTEILGATSEKSSATRLILVSGPEGTGKSSLINRAVHWFTSQLSQGGVNNHHVDLTDESAAGLGSEEWVRRIATRLIDKISFLNILSTTETDKLDGKALNPQNAIPFLAELLAAKQCRLHVLLPPIEILEQLLKLVEIARPPLLLFTETADETLSRTAIGKYPETAGAVVRVVSVGNLAAGDGWRFVSSRQGAHPGAAIADESVVTRFMEARIRGRGSTSIQELQRTCQIVWDSAEESGVMQISYTDFQDSYVLKGILP